MKLDDKTQTIVSEAKEMFGEVYLIGGAVRDLVLGRTPKDYDITTPMLPEDIEANVRSHGKRAYLTGKRFGTIGYKSNGLMLECTTFRSEAYTPGSRKPAVEFIKDLREDQARRDFTFNSIAMSPDGTLIDPFGGRLDILEKKIKAVGDAKDRFKEDPLRLLRAARFAAQLGFEIDPNMIGKARHVAHTIYDVSRERWVGEMDKLLGAPHSDEGVKAILQMHVLRFILPELVDGHDFRSTDSLGTEDAWVALLAEIGKPATRTPAKDGMMKYPKHELVGAEMAVGIAARLKWSNDRTDYIVEAIKKHRCQV